MSAMIENIKQCERRPSIIFNLDKTRKHTLNYWYQNIRNFHYKKGKMS